MLQALRKRRLRISSITCFITITYASIGSAQTAPAGDPPNPPAVERSNAGTPKTEVDPITTQPAATPEVRPSAAATPQTHLTTAPTTSRVETPEPAASLAPASAPKAPPSTQAPLTLAERTATAIASKVESAKPEASPWHFGGYGELLLTTSFYHPDITNKDPNYRETHLDLSRFSLFVGTNITERISFTGEIEFEHGGTGVAREVEWEEFGEYETEIEKGGEVVLEQAFLEGKVIDGISLRAGHLLVPVGMTTMYHTPNLFSSTRRPESESQILPSIWHENGVELVLAKGDFHARLQAVTGLDSTGFSSSRWIAGGTQRTFERPLVNDIATVMAVDYLGLPGTVVGASVYTSGTNRNRPKRDLYDTEGRVVLGDVHVRYQNGPLKLRGLLLAGYLQNAAAITRANATLSSALGASRTAVGRAAYAAWFEAAYDVIPLLGVPSRQRLEPFARLDLYDSMWRAGADFDNPLMQRRTLTAGLNYFPHPRVVTKAEFVSRWLNENRDFSRRQSELNFALGFVL